MRNHHIPWHRSRLLSDCGEHTFSVTVERVCNAASALDESEYGFMAKSIDASYAKNLEFYEKLVATNPGIERKGDTMPYTSVNGHMFSVLTKEGKLALRLPADLRDAFLKKYKTKLCEQYGIVMKEYVEVPDALLAKTLELKPYFDESFSYTSALKPKPTTKKKTTAAKKPAAVKRKAPKKA